MVVMRGSQERRAHPLPARLHADALPIVSRLLDCGERAVWRLMQEVRTHEVVIEDGELAQLTNVNTPQDWTRISRPPPPPARS